MGYRIFRDSTGTEWQTWDVIPRLSERRMGERRVAVAIAPRVERRRLAERRERTGGRPMLSAGLDAGWLCFEASVDKRRLTPIPADWERCPADQLEAYCRAARPALRVSASALRSGNRSSA